jgi:hypothetical protein
MDNYVDDIIRWAQDQLLPILGAVAILVVGWIVAIIVAGLVQALLNRTSLDEKIGTAMSGEGKQPVKLDRWITGLVKWGILLYAFVLFLDALGLDAASKPIGALLEKVTGFMPQILGAAVLAIVGWIVAVLVRKLVGKGLGALGLDARVKKATGDEETELAVSASIANAAYWVVLLLFLLLVLDSLQLKGLMEPLQAMTEKALAFLPNLFSAAIILLLGWFVATLVRKIVTSLIHASGLERLLSKAGLEKVGKGTIAGLLGTVAFLLVLLPVISMSLDALQLDKVAEPVNGLIDTFFSSIPNLLYAAVILAVAVFVGRLVSGLVSDLLARLGFDRILSILGLSQADPDQMKEGKRPSDVVGTIVFLIVVLLASLTALELLGWEAVSRMVHAFMQRAAGWLLGLFIFALGLWLSKLIADLIRDRDTAQSNLLATVARVAILVVAGIAAMTEMDIDADVIKWSAILSVAGASLGCALAFGLGGQRHAAETLDRWKECGKDDE